jgi:hypothetical protein
MQKQQTEGLFDLKDFYRNFVEYLFLEKFLGAPFDW